MAPRRVAFARLSSSRMCFGIIPCLVRTDTQALWQLESLRPRRSRIEEQRVAKPFGSRLVRVAKDADVRSFAIQKGSSVLRELSAFIQNMTDGDAASG